MSAGFANAIPVVALTGAFLLSGIATPVLLYKSRIGLMLGVILLTVILPYSIGLAISGLEDGLINLGVIFSLLPALLAIFTLYLSAKQLFFKKKLLIYANKPVH